MTDHYLPRSYNHPLLATVRDKLWARRTSTLSRCGCSSALTKHLSDAESATGRWRGGRHISGVKYNPSPGQAWLVKLHHMFSFKGIKSCIVEKHKTLLFGNWKYTRLQLDVLSQLSSCQSFCTDDLSCWNSHISVKVW